MPVQLRAGAWIHSGSLVCPACTELCGDCSGEGGAEEVALDHLYSHITFRRTILTSGRTWEIALKLSRKRTLKTCCLDS